MPRTPDMQVVQPIQPAQTLLGARALADWMREGGRPQRPVSGYRAKLAWQAFWFERNWATQQRRLAPLPQPADAVFIVGLWRSGTTALHELLAACTGWTTPQTWQCFTPSTCFLTSAPSQEAITERPMDRGQIATHGPQEDEFALLLLGEPSIYRGFIDPRRLRTCGREQWAETPPVAVPAAAATLPRWQAFVRGVAAGAPGRLLLKSPNHSFRLPLLRALFPDARFVWIARHTGEVLASNLKMWRAMMGLYALWDCPAGELQTFLQEVVEAAARVIERALQEMPPERLLWIDFETLRAAPQRTLEQVLDFLGTRALNGADRARGIEQALSQVPIHPGTRAEAPVGEAVLKLEKLMSAAKQRFGDRGSIARRSVGR